MEKKKILLIAVMSIIGLISCSKEDIPEGKTNSSNTLSVSSVSLSTMMTRTTSSVDVSGSSIGIYQLVGTSYAGDLARYDYTTSWVANVTSPMVPIYLNNNTCNVIGFYPWGVAGINKTTTTSYTLPSAITLTSQAYAAAQDLSYQLITGLKNSSYTASFSGMQHVYAKLTFRISRDATTYGGAADIKKITIGTTTGSNVNVSCPIDLTKDDGTGTGIQKIYGTMTAGQVAVGTGSTNLNTSSVPAATGSPSTTYFSQSVLMVPVSSITSNVAITFNVDGTTLNGTIPFASLAALKQGNEYVVNVLIKGTTLVISGVQVTDWGTDAAYTPVVVTPSN
jgi:hypothetical protein